MTSVLDRAPAVVRAPATLTRHVGRRVLGVPALVVREATAVPRSVARAVVPPPAECGNRQVWTAGGNAMIEVRELDRVHGHRRATLSAELERAMSRVEGIRWARLDAPTSRIALRFDRERHDLASLVDALAAAERLLVTGLDEADEGPAEAAADLLDTLADESEAEETAETPPPGSTLQARDDAAHHRRALAVHLTALGAAAAGRLAGLPRLPSGSGAVVALLEHQPWVRDRLEHRLGRARADRLLILAGAVTNGLTRNVPALLLDSAMRGSAIRAAETRLSAFEARRPDLHATSRPAAVAVTGTDARPVPLPPSPVDRLARRMARAALVASGAVLALTGNPDLAGRVVLVAVPRAAHLAKQGYVDALIVGLGRRGVVVHDPGALRRLDRVTAVLVESSTLHDTRPLIVTARADAEGWTDARVWRAAQRLLDGDRDAGRRSARRALRAVPDGDTRVDRRVLVEDGVPVGEVTVGRELDPFTDALLSGVREAGLRLLLTDDPTAAELGNRADEVVRDGHGTPGWLRAEVRRLQAGGEVVAVVGTDPEALDAADVAIGLVPPDGAVPWAADLLCGPGLVEVPRIVAAMREARAVDQRGIRVALGASFLGALILALGPAGRGGRALVPVTMAGAGELVSGIRAGRAVARRPDPVPVPHTSWHALDADEVLARLPDPGPADPDVAGDGARPGPLARSVHAAATLARNVRAELADPLTPVLGTGAAASAVIGSPVDAFLVGGVLAGSATISGAQRMRAERALEGLLSGQRLTARVVDGGEARAGGNRAALREVPATNLRPGHVLDLRAGDVVPADARLLDVQDLEVDEATLTGESTAISKDLPATPGAELPDRVCMVYDGTTVVAGWARAVVVAVGAATEAGRALALAGRAVPPAGMQNRLEELTSRGVPVTLLGGAAVTAMALLRGRPLRAAIGSGVSVAVAAVPEGLPLMATVAQLGAARRLSRRGVLVRASRTVEALGRVDTLCFDKTGTLTEGRLRLVRAAGLDGEWAIEAPESRRLLREAAHAGPSRNGNRPLAHATDQAVLDAAQAVLGSELDLAWEELAEIPFHSERGFSAVVGRTPTTTRLVVKGAPEVLLPRCTAVRDDRGKRPLDRAGHRRAVSAVHSLAAQGLRVLAVARRSVDDVVPGRLAPDDVADIGDLTLLGFVGLADTPRPHAGETVAALRRAGIATVMITGDHPVTARAIAGTLGIEADHLVTGPELAALEESTRAARIAEASVFARVSPEQKLQIIEALQHAGRVVAMAGDGANDAAAIRLADVGIGMAAKGSTSARSAADLVLTEPDVSLVLDALVEGRAMWRRVRDAVAVLLGGNAGEVGFTLLGTALAGRAPINTRQFLVVNMFTDLLPSMALALAPTPSDPEERSALLAAGPPSLGAPLLRDIGVRGTVTALGALTAWQIGRVTGTRRRASTIALAGLVGAELGQTLLLGGRNPLVLATGMGSAAALAAIIQVPGVSQFFGCTPLDPLAWGVVLGCSAGATLASAALPRLARHRPTPGDTVRRGDTIRPRDTMRAALVPGAATE